MSDYEMSDEELMIVKLEELQKENSQLKVKEQTLEPLLKTIRQQEQEITHLNSLLIGERKQNENLLELAKNEKKLNADNEKLKKIIADYEMNLKQKDREIAALQQATETITAQTKAIADKMPKVDEVEQWTKTFRGVDDTISLVNLASIANTAFVVIFMIVTAFTAWQVYHANDNAAVAAIAATAASRALYDHEGYAVLPGTQASNRK